MKRIFHTGVILLALSGWLSTPALAQTYTAIADGAFSKAIIWSVSPAGSPTTPPSGGTLGSKTTINLNGHTVDLDINFSVGNATNAVTMVLGANGVLTVVDKSSLTIAANGRINAAGGTINVRHDGDVFILTGGRLNGGVFNLGDHAASQKATNLVVAQNLTPVAYAMEVDQMTVNKATADIAANATLKTTCNLIVIDGSIKVNGVIIIGGNLDLSGGSITTCGSGSYAIAGCVFGSNGQINQLNCGGSTPGFCAAGRTVGCPPASKSDGCNTSIANTGEFCRPLPVELVTFTAVSKGLHSVEVRWATATEKNSANFVVERSADCKEFRAVATVRAAGNSTGRLEYELMDVAPLVGTSYYRLKQVDLDATSSYSPVRTVKLGGAGSSALEVYPGSVAQHWVVSSSLPAEATGTSGAAVQVVDMLGRVQAATGTPDAAQAGRWALDLHTLPAGVYVVRLRTGAGTFSQRIVQ